MPRLPLLLFRQRGGPLNPNRTLDRLAACPMVFLRLSATTSRPATGILATALSRRGPAFDKDDCQSARRQNEIALDSNDRFGVKIAHKSLAHEQYPRANARFLPYRLEHFGLARSGPIGPQAGCLALAVFLPRLCTFAAQPLQFCCTAFAAVLRGLCSSTAKAVQQNCKSRAAFVQ